MKFAENKAPTYAHFRRSLRAGTSTLDVLVSFTLLVAVMGVLAPLVVRHSRLLTSHRNYRIALDELTNQADRLASLPQSELERALNELKPSSFLEQRLNEVALRGQLQPAEFGARVTLSLSWSEAGRKEAPLVLAFWVSDRTLGVSAATEDDAP